MCKAFRDEFSPYSALTLSDGLMLHALILQQMDSTIDNGICVQHVPLGYKGKDSVISGKTHIEHINNLENQLNDIKVYSKKDSAYISVVLFCAFISAIELKKQVAHCMPVETRIEDLCMDGVVIIMI